MGSFVSRLKISSQKIGFAEMLHWHFDQLIWAPKGKAQKLAAQFLKQPSAKK